MREQTTRLNTRPSVETQEATYTTGVSNYSQYQPIAPVSKGSKLGEALGLVSKGIEAGIGLYKADADTVNAEAMKQFNSDKMTFLEEINALNTATEKAEYIRNKVTEFSSPDVNVKYREAFVNSFSGMYNTVLGQAKEEGFKVLEGDMTNDFIANVAAGKLDYETVASKYNGRLPKDRYHKLVVSALESQLLFEANAVVDEDSLAEFEAKKKALISEYKSNVYTGGSKSKEAIDLQLKLDKTLSSVTTGIKKQFAENFQVQRETILRDFSMTPDLFDKWLDTNITKGYQDASDAIGIKEKYRKIYDENESVLRLQENPDLLSDPMLASNYAGYNEKQKAYVKEYFQNNMAYRLQNGLYDQAFEGINNAPKDVSTAFMNNMFDSDQQADAIRGKLGLYKEFQKTYAGRNALAKVDKNSQVLFSILSYKPNADVEAIQQFLNNPKANKEEFDKASDRMDWKETKAMLTPADQSVANSLLEYYFSKSGDIDDALEKTQMFVDSRVVKISKGTFSGKTVYSGFNDEYQAETVDKYFKKVLGDKFENFERIEATGDSYKLYDKNNPLITTTYKYKDLLKDWAKEKAKEDTPLTMEDINEAGKLFTANFVNLLEGTIDDIITGKSKDFLTGLSTHEQMYVLPIAISNIYRAGSASLPLANWLRGVGESAGEFVLNLSSNVVSRGNLQLGRDLLQQAGVNVVFKNNGTKAVLTKTAQSVGNVKKGIQIVGGNSVGKRTLGVAGAAAGFGLSATDVEAASTFIQNNKDKALGQLAQDGNIKDMTLEEIGNFINNIGLDTIDLSNVTTNSLPSENRQITERVFDNNMNFGNDADITDAELNQMVADDAAFAEAIKMDETLRAQNNSLASQVFNTLIKKNEGPSGDTTGAAPTGKYGLTVQKYKEMVNKYGKLTQEEASIKYLEELETKWNAKPGFADASDTLKMELLDASYNLGEGSINYTGLSNALATLGTSTDEADVLAKLLDTAQSGKKSLRGIAKRRAESYNKVATDKITSIKQEADGTLIYYKGNQEFYRFKASKGRHPSSSVGTLTIK